jgi:N-glycosylase/DNA lyase
VVELRLRGPAGEPIDLRRLFLSHGVASLPPMSVDEQRWVFEVTVGLPGRRPRTLRVEPGSPGHAKVTILGSLPDRKTAALAVGAIRQQFSLDRDLSGFYRLAERDPELSWAASGAGRMIRGSTVFEDVVKTICTTNCSWAATTRMVTALVEHLGERADGAPATGWRGRAFPSASAMASASDDFYRRVAGAGYRGPYLREVARRVAEDGLDLEALAAGTLPEEQVTASLLSLPGVGPYAAAHIGLMLGRYSTLILDSWTRPTYARLLGRRSVSDRSIIKRFKRYGPYAGLAFWLFCTRDWVPELGPQART